MSEHIKSYLVSIEKYSRIIGIIMYIISVIFTCNLMLTFGSSGREKVLYLVFAIVIQSCQLISLGISLILGFIGNKAKSKMFFMGFVYLFVLSLLGTIGFFAVSQREQTTKAYKTDVKYAEMKKQLDDYDRRIAVLDKQIESFASKGLMTKGVAPSREEKASLSEKRDKLADDLKNYTPQATSDALYSSLSEFLDVPPDSLKLGLNFAYALILELMSAGLLWFSFFLKFNVLSNTNSIQNDDYTREESIKPFEKPVYVPNPANTAMNLKDSDKDLQIRYLLSEIQQLKKDRIPQHTVLSENPELLKQKPVLNQAESLDSVNADSAYTNTTLNTNTGLSKDTIQAYITALFASNKGNGALTGRRQISDSIGLNNKVCDTIHNMLKKLNLIRVENMKTYPVVSKEQMIAAALNCNKQSIAQGRIGF